MLLGKAVMINWSDVAPEHRGAYYEWHSREHMVGRVAIRGYQRGRRYIAARAQRDFLVLYEVDDLSVVTGADYLAKANKPSPLTLRTTPFVKNSVRGLANVRTSLGIGTGGYALTLRFDPRIGGEEELGRYLMRDALPRAAGRPDIVGTHFLVADQAASSMVPVERQGRPTIIPNWIVVLEGVSLEAVEGACDANLSAQLLKQHGCADPIARDTYSLQLLVPKGVTVIGGS
jgi:hypothetical protein